MAALSGQMNLGSRRAIFKASVPRSQRIQERVRSSSFRARQFAKMAQTTPYHCRPHWYAVFCLRWRIRYWSRVVWIGPQWVTTRSQSERRDQGREKR